MTEPTIKPGEMISAAEYDRRLATQGTPPDWTATNPAEALENWVSTAYGQALADAGETAPQIDPAVITLIVTAILELVQNCRAKRSDEKIGDDLTDPRPIARRLFEARLRQRVPRYARRHIPATLDRLHQNHRDQGHSLVALVAQHDHSADPLEGF